MFQKYTLQAGKISKLNSPEGGTSSFKSTGRNSPIPTERKGSYIFMANSPQQSPRCVTIGCVDDLLQDQNEEILKVIKEKKTPRCGKTAIPSTFGDRKKSTEKAYSSNRTPRSANQSTRSISFAPPQCSRCIEKDAVLIEVRNHLRHTTEKLRPFRSAGFAFHEQQRMEELQRRLASRKSTLSAMNQGIIEESALLSDLAEGVIPKLKREKQFGTMFERKKDDVVISQRNWEAINGMIEDYQAFLKKLISLHQNVKGTQFELEEDLRPQDTLEFVRDLSNSQLLSYFYSSAFPANNQEESFQSEQTSSRIGVYGKENSHPNQIQSVKDSWVSGFQQEHDSLEYSPEPMKKPYLQGSFNSPLNESFQLRKKVKDFNSFRHVVSKLDTPERFLNTNLCKNLTADELGKDGLMSLDEDDINFLRNGGHLDTPDFGNSQVRLIKSSPIKTLEDFEEDQVNYTGSSLHVSDFTQDI